MRAAVDLNDDTLIDADDGIEGQRFASEAADDCKVQAFVGDIEARLEALIRRADMVVGCMAWLTNQRIIKALSDLPLGCQVIVQKEDWMRPDTAPRSRFYAGLRQAYDSMPLVRRDELPGMASQLSYCGDAECEAVRCAGVIGEGMQPRMHHKFLVFLRKFNGVLTPHAVWTGSFNATENATRSRENGVYIRSETLAEFYALEWSRALAMSEPLDWNAKYIAPQWRFGS
jgi:hypothetical protein